MLEAEENGLTQANVDDELKSQQDPLVQRLLGVNGRTTASCSGSTTSGPTRIVKQVGNYGESFERNVGTGSPLKLPRGVNSLWTKGGLMYPLPMR